MIKYENEMEAQKACEYMNGRELIDKTVYVYLKREGIEEAQRKA